MRRGRPIRGLLRRDLTGAGQCAALSSAGHPRNGCRPRNGLVSLGVAVQPRKRYGRGMRLGEIKTAITELSEQERTELAAWLLSLDREAWDRQIKADFSPGGAGTKLLEEVDSAIDRGDFKPLE